MAVTVWGGRSLKDISQEFKRPKVRDTPSGESTAGHASSGCGGYAVMMRL
jgi:hypothetical protein